MKSYGKELRRFVGWALPLYGCAAITSSVAVRYFTEVVQHRLIEKGPLKGAPILWHTANQICSGLHYYRVCAQCQCSLCMGKIGKSSWQR